jgi:hypothetical protein
MDIWNFEFLMFSECLLIGKNTICSSLNIFRKGYIKNGYHVELRDGQTTKKVDFLLF